METRPGRPPAGSAKDGRSSFHLGPLRPCPGMHAHRRPHACLLALRQPQQRLSSPSLIPFLRSFVRSIHRALVASRRKSNPKTCTVKFQLHLYIDRSIPRPAPDRPPLVVKTVHGHGPTLLLLPAELYNSVAVPLMDCSIHAPCKFPEFIFTGIQSLQQSRYTQVATVYKIK